MSSKKNARLQRELAMFSDSPPHGISCWSKEDSLQHLEARKSCKIQASVACVLSTGHCSLCVASSVQLINL